MYIKALLFNYESNNHLKKKVNMALQYLHSNVVCTGVQ